MFVVGKDGIDKFYLVFGARANRIFLSYSTFGTILGMIANEIIPIVPVNVYNIYLLVVIHTIAIYKS